MMRDLTKSLRDLYLDSLVPAENEAQVLARKFSDQLGLSPISLSPAEGQILQFLVSLAQPQKILEIGTLTGLSALYMAARMPKSSKLWTLEKNQAHADFAQQVFKAAGLSSERVQILLGDARATLSELEKEAPFDFVFIDGNKAAYGDYLAWALSNTKKGSWIVADNVFLSGAVWGAETKQKFNEKQIKTLQAFNLQLSDQNLFESVCLPTNEGLYVARKK